LTPTHELIDLDEVIGSALKRLERALAGHVVRVNVGQSVPMLTLDFVLTEQVVANLLDNAAKYSPPGTTIDIAVTASTDSVVLTISDEGPGIAPADAERIFERFFRIETPDRRPAGVGLGLAICKGFVEAMGGTISVSNRASGRGATFRLAFPVDGAEAAAA
jgi:two-component system sensor histidine kinase KdpD